MKSCKSSFHCWIRQLKGLEPPRELRNMSAIDRMQFLYRKAAATAPAATAKKLPERAAAAPVYSAGWETVGLAMPVPLVGIAAEPVPADGAWIWPSPI